MSFTHTDYVSFVLTPGSPFGSGGASVPEEFVFTNASQDTMWIGRTNTITPGGAGLVPLYPGETSPPILVDVGDAPVYLVSGAATNPEVYRRTNS